MTGTIPLERRLLDIGHDLKIGINGSGTWQVWAKNGCYELNAPSDFYRVVVLLEKSFGDAKALLDDYAACQCALQPFPLWRVVAAGLACQSDWWASRALHWLPDLPIGETASLLDLLIEVGQATWASQKSRQLADRFARKLGASRG